jgi:hypothetical protein
MVMTRGGIREGAGSKPGWKKGKTKIIRVPEVLADQILDYARKLDDEDIIESVTESKVVNLAGISLKTYNGKMAIHIEDLVKGGYEIMPEHLGQMFKSILSQRLRS